MSTNWKNLAIAEAQSQGCSIDIVLATVEAETGGTNISGDSNNAMGYGQVWPKWHLDAFQYAANKYRLALPDTLEGKMQLTLSNDAFSMAVAVYVIKQVWNESGANFRTFSLKYVGPAIPDSDYNRRYNIWLQYQGQGGNVNSSNFSASGTGLSNNGGGTINEQPILTSSLGIDDPSEKILGNVLFGRRYRVIVSDKDGTALDVSKLRCTFRIEKTLLQPPNLCEISVYNLNADTENAIIKEGSRIVVEAGYEGDQYGLIFDGDVIQCIRSKEDGVNFRLAIMALDGERFINSGFVNFSVAKGQTSRQVIENVVSKATVTSDLGSISDELGEAELTRGKVVFGLARDYLRQLAQTHTASFYMEDGKVNIIRATDPPEGEVIELSPTSGLVGNPTQNDLGITFRALLNPRIKVKGMVHIDNSQITTQAVQPGSSQILRSLDGEGLYRVIGIVYTGDTRGDNWYIDCTTVSQAGLMPGLMNTSTANPW